MNVEPGGGGTIEVEHTAIFSYPDTLSFRSGLSVRLEAVPVSGYRFKNWSGDLSGTTNPTTILIDCDKKLTANFSQIMHTLTMQVSGSGSSIPTVGVHSYAKGSVVDITATPDIDWQFEGWVGDVADLDLATTVVTINSDKTVTANFSQSKPDWWLVGGTPIGLIIIGVIIWLAVRRRTA